MLRILLLLFLSPILLLANEPEVKVTSTIKSATVFLSGAQVNRTAAANIPNGESLIRFIGLTPNMDTKSIQVKGEGNFTIIGVQHEANYEEKPDLGESVAALDAQIKMLQLQVEDEGILLQAIKEEEEFLKANRSIGGANSGITTNELKAGATYFGQRSLELKKEKLAINRRVAKLQEEQKALQGQRKNLTAEVGKYTVDILVKVNAKSAVKGDFKISYVVKNAGWFPNYDIRVKDVASNVSLDYRASVFQSTGEDWDKINLTLSTGNPFESGTKPKLEAWRLAFAQSFVRGSRGQTYGYAIDGVRAQGVNQVTGMVTDEYGEPLIGANIIVRGTSNGTMADVDGKYSLELPPNAKSIIVSYVGFESAEVPISGANMNVVLSEGAVLEEVVVTGMGGRLAGVRLRGKSKDKRQKKQKATASIPLETTKEAKATTVNFIIDIPYTINSTGKQTLVKIKAYELPASYEYFAIPKLDPDAFLTANVTGWEEYDFLSGEANLFFEGTYLGKSYLDVYAVEDTLALSLGRDRNIVIDRKRVKDFSKRQFIGTNKSESRAWEIDIRNKKKQSIHLIVEDQFPISTNEKIEVKQGKYAGATLDDKTGILTWELDIQSNTNKKLEFDYEVKYPKKERLVLE